MARLDQRIAKPPSSRQASASGKPRDARGWRHATLRVAYAAADGDVPLSEEHWGRIARIHQTVRPWPAEAGAQSSRERHGAKRRVAHLTGNGTRSTTILRPSARPARAACAPGRDRVCGVGRSAACGLGEHGPVDAVGVLAGTSALIRAVAGSRPDGHVPAGAAPLAAARLGVLDRPSRGRDHGSVGRGGCGERDRCARD